MAVKSDLVAGTITLTNGSIDFTGTGTSFLQGDVREGDEFKQIEGQTQWEAMVASITSNTAGTLVRPWGGATGTFAYRLRYQPDGTRSTAQARQLIELLGDGTLLSIAGLVGPGVIELLPGGGARVVPKTDLVSGANYDVQVANLAARAAYDGQTAGFSVLVSNTGDGRSALYSKVSNVNADWSAAAYVTGPSITLAVTEVDEVPYGTPPNVALTARAGGYDLAFEIPRGMIIQPGTTTTLAPDQPAAVNFVPITGGYRLDISLPRGPTGDINGVTPFWVGRLGADTTALAARAGLGLVKQISTTDTTAGSLLTLGAFGIGEGLVATEADLNNYTIPGDYITPSGPANLPPGFTAGGRVILRVGGGGSVPLVTQQATDPYLGLTATRSKSGVTWNEWVVMTPSGSVINSWYGAYTTYFSGSALVPVDDTPPTGTEGVQIITLSTGVLKSSTSKLRMRFSGLVGADQVTSAILSLHVNGNPAARTAFGVIRYAGDLLFMGGEYEFSPGATTSVTVSVRAGAQAGNMRLNGLTSRLFGGAAGLSLVVEEIRA